MAQLGTGRYLECRMHTYMHMHIRFISIYLAQYYFAYMCCRYLSSCLSAHQNQRTHMPPP